MYRLFAPGADEEVYESSPTLKRVEESLDDYKLKDTFHLALNYKDPFLESGILESGQPDKPEVKFKTNLIDYNRPALPPAINWDFIKYTGFIINPGSKKLVSIISINGKERMMMDGGVADQVKLIKNYKDSIKVSFNNKNKFIRLK